MEYIRAQGQQLYSGENPILLRGFGLGGWLLPEGYMWRFFTKCDRPRRMEQLINELCGAEYEKQFWQKYYDNYITKSDIALITSEGFNCVRLPINARHIEDALPRIDSLIEWCREYGVYIILDMHAAPGGQTGQNIDDSERDLPELFMNWEYQRQLISLWRELASRYKNEPVIAGYDLLNEPLPKWHNQYNHLLTPLYDELIRVIREVDTKHLIILEGAHWATDFSVFDNWAPPQNEQNLMLQFHKYWSPPDEESLAPYLEVRERLKLPLFMGEGGENNCDWYTAVFPLYENLDISWSFWSYKKMENTNSPISFAVPNGWQKVIDYLDGGEKLPRDEAMKIFDSFLHSISKPTINADVFRSLKRESPIVIPCEYYDSFHVIAPRIEGAFFRAGDPVSILFADGHTGEPDYRRYGGELQPESENLVVVLNEGEWLDYGFTVAADGKYDITISSLLGDGKLIIGIDGNLVNQCNSKAQWKSIPLVSGRHVVRIYCINHVVTVDTIGILPSKQ